MSDNEPTIHSIDKKLGEFITFIKTHIEHEDQNKARLEARLEKMEAKHEALESRVTTMAAVVELAKKAMTSMEKIKGQILKAVIASTFGNVGAILMAVAGFLFFGNGWNG